MKHKLFTLFLINNFCLIATPEELINRAKLDHYLQCKTLFTLDNFNKNNTKKATLTTRIAESNCFEEFKIILELLQAKKALDEKIDQHDKNLRATLCISEKDFEEGEERIFFEMVEELNK